MSEILSNSPHRLDFDHLNPDGNYDYTVVQDDTAWDIGRRFLDMIGADNEAEAFAIIAAHNGLEMDENGFTLIRPGDPLEIPIREGFEIIDIHSENTSIRSLTAAFQQRALLPIDYTAEDIAYMNGVDADTPVDFVQMPIIDDFAHISALPVPEIHDQRPVNLVVIEAGDGHHELAYNVAASVIHALDPGFDLANVHAINAYNLDNTSETAQSLVMETFLEGTPLVFSFSIANNPELLETGIFQECEPSHSRNILSQAEVAYDLTEAVFFVSAGNSFAEDPNAVVTFDAASGRNGVYVGATDQLPTGEIYITQYSSPNADFLAPPIVNHDGDDIHGTSFTMPDMAANYTVMASRFGDRLSHNEIMAAAAMSTDIDIFEHNPTEQYLQQAEFLTNAGGRPFHERGGAGIIDRERWQENLERMAALDATMGLEAKYLSETVDLGAMEPQNISMGASQYVYHVPIPADMTLDRLTLVLPQDGAHSNTTIISPSGFQHELARSSDQIQTSSAFMLEDVQAGDVITIYTETPFAEGAEITIRGYEDGNLVQALREQLNQEGLLHQPSTVYMAGVATYDLQLRENGAPRFAAAAATAPLQLPELNTGTPDALNNTRIIDFDF